LSNPKDNEDSGGKVSSESILRITDELVHQVDITKKIVLLMIVAVVIAVPVSWHLAPFVKGVPFRLVGYVAIATAVIFIAIGARQWYALSTWTRKYKAYKEMQKKIDAKLDFEGDSNNS